MAKHQGADEIQQQCIDAMGDELGRLYFDLWHHLTWLYTDWGSFKSLFEINEEQKDVLEKIANDFMNVVHRLYLDGILLHICRLTDPAEMGKRENVSFQRLPCLINDIELQAAISESVDAVVCESAFARERRNRKLAHLDLPTVRKQNPQPFPDYRYADIEATMTKMASLLNKVQRHYQNCMTLYDMWVGYGDAGHLIRCAERGYREIEKDRDRLVE